MVDAGMKELNKTGWIHNRSRMIVASYLSKNLLVDWRWGERYFAQNLIDYDPCSNNGAPRPVPTRDRFGFLIRTHKQPNLTLMPST